MSGNYGRAVKLSNVTIALIVGRFRGFYGRFVTLCLASCFDRLIVKMH